MVKIFLALLMAAAGADRANAAWCIQSQPGNPAGEEWLVQMWPEDQDWCLSQGTFWSGEDAPPGWAIGQYEGWCYALQAQSDAGSCFAADPSYQTNNWAGPAAAGAWYALLNAWNPGGGGWSGFAGSVEASSVIQDMVTVGGLGVSLGILIFGYRKVRNMLEEKRGAGIGFSVLETNARESDPNYVFPCGLTQEGMDGEWADLCGERRAESDMRMMGEIQEEAIREDIHR